MKIVIKNWHLFYVVVFMIIMICFGIAVAVYDPSMGSHDTLWSDRLEPKTSDKIIISGDVQITGNLQVDGDFEDSSGGAQQGSVVVYSYNKACSDSKDLTLKASCKTQICRPDPEGGMDTYYGCSAICGSVNAPMTCPNDLVGELV